MQIGVWNAEEIFQWLTKAMAGVTRKKPTKTASPKVQVLECFMAEYFAGFLRMMLDSC